MFKHKESNVVLEDWFVSYANSSQKNQIISEFYGPEFSLFKVGYQIVSVSIWADFILGEASLWKYDCIKNKIKRNKDRPYTQESVREFIWNNI